MMCNTQQTSSHVNLWAVILLLFAVSGCTSGSTIDHHAGKGELPHVYTGGVVAADHVLGSQAGVAMLAQGGNAVDAAVATSFCQAVVRPYSCGLGGGGFMLIRMASSSTGKEVASPSTAVAIVYREVAPSAVGPDYYEELEIKNASRFGPHAVGVPGTVAGLIHALENYGTLELDVILGPAVRAAEEGFAADAHYVSAAHSVLDRLETSGALREQIGAESYAFLLKRFLSDGHPKVGDVIRQPELAKTLRLISRQGEAVFYSGEIADAIAARCPQIVKSDLERYTAQTMAPLQSRAFGHTFYTMPPPSSGGVAIQQVLRFIEAHWTDGLFATPYDPEYAHLLIESMKHAFADRAEWLADSRFVDVPVERLVSQEYIRRKAAQFDPEYTLGSSEYGSRRIQLPDDAGTSHMSVIDQWGNAVACTETINLEFGSLFVIPEFGIIMNNEMDDFLTLKGKANAFGLTQSARNLPEPGKYPLSSMSPTIVVGKDGQVDAIAGASGGPRIITGTLQALINTLLFDMNVEEAVRSPRLHHQWMPNAVYLENAWDDLNCESALGSKQHEIRRRESVGNVQIIRRAADGRGYTAASDPRKGGAPAGIN